MRYIHFMQRSSTLFRSIISGLQASRKSPVTKLWYQSAKPENTSTWQNFINCPCCGADDGPSERVNRLITAIFRGRFPILLCSFCSLVLIWKRTPSKASPIIDCCLCCRCVFVEQGDVIYWGRCYVSKMFYWAGIYYLPSVALT